MNTIDLLMPIESLFVLFSQAEPEEAPQQPDSQAIPLPDIREALKKKQMEEELARAQEEEEEQRVLIKRSDKEAFAKVSPCSSLEKFFEVVSYSIFSNFLS